MRVAFFEVKDWERSYLAERLPSDQTMFEPGALAIPGDELRSVEAISIFIYSRVTREVLNAMPNLKFIATRSTGFDHIDLEACRSRGIAASNVPSYGENTVAELTIALLLMLSRKVH